MKEFKQLGIPKPAQCFTGDKMSIDRILNRQITVHAFRIEDSKIKQNTKYLQLQFSIGDNKHVLFTGSAALMNTIMQVKESQLPFTTTITKENRHYEFN